MFPTAPLPLVGGSPLAQLPSHPVLPPPGVLRKGAAAAAAAAQAQAQAQVQQQQQQMAQVQQQVLQQLTPQQVQQQQTSAVPSQLPSGLLPHQHFVTEEDKPRYIHQVQVSVSLPRLFSGTNKV